jgi:hypothetical protein
LARDLDYFGNEVGVDLGLTLSDAREAAFF